MKTEQKNFYSRGRSQTKAVRGQLEQTVQRPTRRITSDDPQGYELDTEKLIRLIEPKLPEVANHIRRYLECPEKHKLEWVLYVDPAEVDAGD